MKILSDIFIRILNTTEETISKHEFINRNCPNRNRREKKSDLKIKVITLDN